MNDPLVRMILESTLRGTILIAFAALAAPLARRVFGKNGAHWLWLATLPVLLWPAPPRTLLSLQNLWAHKKSAPVSYAAPAPIAATALPVVAKIHQLYAEPTVTAPTAITQSLGSQPPVLLTPKPVHPTQWLLGIWLSGALFSLTWLARRWLGTMRMLRDARPVDANRALKLLRRFPASNRVSIAVTSQVRAPALAGIWRPRILLPEGWLESLPDHELESVLLHELGHYLRGDLIWEWLFALARCLHWMNPAVWLAERMARHERELACDAWALERSASPAHYGEALLEALQRVHHYTAPTFGVVAMADGIRQISRRLRWIASYRPAPRWRTAAAWIPALVALAAVGSNPLPVQADGPASTPAPKPAEPSLPPAPAPAPPSAAVEAPPSDPLPLAKRPIEMKTEIIRLPESAANQLGWPIAENGSKGIQRILSRAQFRQMIGSVGSQAELLPAPRLTSRSGYRGQMQAIREFRYGKDYKASAPSVPGSVQTANLGMTLEWQADIKSESAVHLNILPTLSRLTGFADAAHVLTPPLTPTPGTDWYHRLVAYEMPDGTGGIPVISTQEGNADMDLNCNQTAIVFGFRDADRSPAPGASKEESMVIYFAIQIDIAQ